MEYEICCVGHITIDKIVTSKAPVYMPGGTSFYFSNAISNMDVQYKLVTALAANEMNAVTALRSKGIDVKVLPSAYTLYFENIYSENQDHRTQRVLQKADPFAAEQMNDVNAKVFHLGPLLWDDMPTELIKSLASKAKISLDVQGFLRHVENYNVQALDWPAKREALPYIHFLKANEYEIEVLTGQSDIHEGAKILFEWGVKEVIITLGSKGSVIFRDNAFYNIPAYHPVSVEDATGCGDTYMAGYLSQRIKGVNIQKAGEFAAAMATLNIESSGPFQGTREDVVALLQSNERASINV
ncbi:MAG: PfkB domain protein [Flavisolibacter sp.]|jgi:sugar/nucleoside kinase (ribokinase family)|nr:PfkB domain protein [Flavisolibacter sp.]